MAQDTTCLMSTVRNIAGHAQVFSFLPPHGVELDADEEYSILGSLVESLGRSDRGDSPRYRQALTDAIDAGLIEIVKTPSPIVLGDDDASYMLGVEAGEVVIQTPCWESESV